MHLECIQPVHCDSCISSLVPRLRTLMCSDCEVGIVYPLTSSGIRGTAGDWFSESAICVPCPVGQFYSVASSAIRFLSFSNFSFCASLCICDVLVKI